MPRSLVCFGDNCIDIYNEGKRRTFVGGNAVNTAVHARAAGAGVSYVGSVGRDEFGRAVLEKLKEKGIDISHVQAFDEETAWTRVELVDGERQFPEEYLGPKDRLILNDEALEFLSKHMLIHNTWQGGTENMLHIFKERCGSLLSMDFGERYSEEFLKKCIPYIDIAFFSTSPEKSAQAFELAENMQALGPACVVVTMGKKGSLALKKGEKPVFIAAKEIEAEDTLGAGDTFIGTFLAGYTAGKKLEECMLEATSAAAENCLRQGGFPSSEVFLSGNEKI